MGNCLHHSAVTSPKYTTTLDPPSHSRYGKLVYVDYQTSSLIISGSPSFELKRMEVVGHSGQFFYFKNDTGSLHHVDMEAEEAAREIADEVLMHKTAKSLDCGCEDEGRKDKDCVCEDLEVKSSVDKDYQCDDCDEESGDKNYKSPEDCEK